MIYFYCQGRQKGDVGIYCIMDTQKAYYRKLLRKLQLYVKLSVFAREYGLSQSTLSLFMKGTPYDNLFSCDRLQGFVDYITDKLQNVV